MNYSQYKKLLEGEKEKLEATLESIGKKKMVGGKEDWSPTYPNLNPLKSNKSEVADEVEEFDNRLGIEKQLEDTLNEVNAALKRIDEGKYGKCENGGEEISAERLKANPASRSCIDHS